MSVGYLVRKAAKTWTSTRPVGEHSPWHVAVTQPHPTRSRDCSDHNLAGEQIASHLWLCDVRGLLTATKLSRFDAKASWLGGLVWAWVVENGEGIKSFGLHLFVHVRGVHLSFIGWSDTYLDTCVTNDSGTIHFKMERYDSMIRFNALRIRYDLLWYDLIR